MKVDIVYLIDQMYKKEKYKNVLLRVAIWDRINRIMVRFGAKECIENMITREVTLIF
jgi:hypothetical protein